MVEGFFTQRPIESFDERIGVRGVVGRWDPTDVHHSLEPVVKVAADAGDLFHLRTELTEDLIVIVNEVAIGMLEGEDVTELVLDEVECGTVGDDGFEDGTPVEAHDDEDVVGLKRDCVLGEEVASENFCGVVSDERAPGLTAASRTGRPLGLLEHVLADRFRSHEVAKLFQLRSDTLGAPSGIVETEFSDEVDELLAQVGPPRSAAPPPKAPISHLMPAHDGVGRNEVKPVAPAVPAPSIDGDPEHAIEVGDARALLLAFVGGKLLSCHGKFGSQSLPGLEEADESNQERFEDRKHSLSVALAGARGN